MEHPAGFVGDIPQNYDQGLGPVIFEDFASDLARRAKALRPANVLEIAAGTGIVSRKLRDELDPASALLVSDLNPPMLEVARLKFERGENVDFAQADAMALPFAAGQFDLAICQFGAMFFPDKPAAFAETRRVIGPGGRFILNIWGSMKENPFSEIAHAVGKQFFPEDPPEFYKVPFAYSDADIVRSDLKAAGFDEVDAQVLSIDKPIRDMGAFAKGIVLGNPLVDEIRQRGGVDPLDVVSEVETAFRSAWGDEPAIMPLRATVYMASST